MSTNVRKHNRGYSGGYPLAVGDRYYSQDIFRDQANIEDRIGIAYNDLTQQTAPYVITGLVATQGAGHTMDISAGKAVVPFSVTLPDTAAAWTVPPSTTTANINVVIDYAGGSSISLASTTQDGATPNYVKLSYTETNGNTRTRAKKAGSYAYEVYDTVTVSIDAVAPTATEINLLTFTTDGATVTVTDNGDTRIGSPFHMQDAVVYDQTTFNDCIRRVAANQYKIRDDIQSLYFANLSGGYDMFSGASPLSGGDGWGSIKTNNCKQIIFEPGAYIYFGDFRGYIEVNTDDCFLQNVNLVGQGIAPVTSLSYSFLLNANRVSFLNCSTSNRTSTGNYRAFKGSATAAHNLTSKYVNCVVRDVTIGAGGNNGGFVDCNNLVNCQIIDLTYTGASAGGIGFRNCYNISNCIIDTMSGAGLYTYGYSSCNQITNCTANEIDSSLNDCYAFNNCNNISNCKATNISSSSGDASGFYNCDYIGTCTAETIDHDGSVASQNAYGFYDCNNISSCYANDIDTNGAGGAYIGFKSCMEITSSYATNCQDGFQTCERLTSCSSKSNAQHGYQACNNLAACHAESNTFDGFFNSNRISASFSTNNGRYGFSFCNQLNTCRANGNTTAQYNNSFADFGASVTVADTAAGGYNG